MTEFCEIGDNIRKELQIDIKTCSDRVRLLEVNTAKVCSKIDNMQADIKDIGQQIAIGYKKSKFEGWLFGIVSAIASGLTVKMFIEFFK